MRRADSWKHAEDTRASHAPAFEACGSASTRPRVRGRHTCADNRQHTRHPHGRSAECSRSHLLSATSGPRGDERDMDQATIGRGSNKQQGSTKHKGRGKSEHTDRDLSLGHMRVRHHTSCVRTRPTAVN
eukprot:scaffold3808_cov112-Isochrysis_galbana.AAC.9